MTAKINSITMYWKGVYVSYDDCDLISDYFNSYSISLKRAIQWIKDDGADKIRVSVVNNDPKIPAIKRLKTIALNCGYEIQDLSQNKKYADGREYRSLCYSLVKGDKINLKPKTLEDCPHDRREGDNYTERCLDCGEILNSSI